MLPYESFVLFETLTRFSLGLLVSQSQARQASQAFTQRGTCRNVPSWGQGIV